MQLTPIREDYNEVKYGEYLLEDQVAEVHRCPVRESDPHAEYLEDSRNGAHYNKLSDHHVNVTENQVPQTTTVL